MQSVFAGSTVIFECRTWHFADLNTSSEPRYGITNYFGTSATPQFRQILNFTLGMKDEVAEKLKPASRALLG